MSAFLGPIHYMMFNKIKIAADRSRFIVNTFREKFGPEADELVKTAIPDGITDFGDKKLDEIIGDANIHSFLQGLIDEVEVKEAALATAYLYKYPDAAEGLLENAFFEHGKQTTIKAIEGKSNGSPLSSFQHAVGMNYLEGMPCDQVSSFMMNGKDSLKVSHSDCLHLAKWETAGAPAHTMCKLLDKWVAGCANAVDPKLALARSASIVNGASECLCTVSAA